METLQTWQRWRICRCWRAKLPSWNDNKYSKHRGKVLIYYGCSSVFDRKFSLEGFSDWKCFSGHNASHHHTENFKKWHLHLKTTPVDEQLSTQKANQVKFQTKERETDLKWADVAATLARLRLSFRGHDESEDSTNKGVSREITELVARYDKLLLSHHGKPKKEIHPTSQHKPQMSWSVA